MSDDHISDVSLDPKQIGSYKILQPLGEGGMGRPAPAARPRIGPRPVSCPLGEYTEAEPHLLEAFEAFEPRQEEEVARWRTVLRRLVTLYESWENPGEAARYQARLDQLPDEDGAGD